VLRGFAVSLLCATVIATAITVAFAWIYPAAVLHSGCQGDRAGLTVAGYHDEAVAFKSRSGPTLRGWFTRGSQHPEIVIVVLPGHAGNTSSVIPDAAIVAEAGYSVLIYEHRSCADPSLTASTGYWEAFDLLGAVDYLRTRPDVEHIGALGFSEGGTAVLLAASREPGLEAVIAKGGYASLRDDIVDPEFHLGWAGQAFRQIVLWSFEQQASFDVDDSAPIAVIDQISPRPMFLIYGELEAVDGERLLAAAREPKSLWIVPGANHGEYQDKQPEEYVRRVVAFFDDSFAVSRLTLNAVRMVVAMMNIRNVRMRVLKPCVRMA